ncbi:MAG: ATP phosphoribosyltransferase [Chloroflexota bacterium]
MNFRISLPSKGRLAEESLSFLESCGLRVYKPNPRQYEALLPDLPDVKVIFQRPADIVASVTDGSVDFGITGLDLVLEKSPEPGSIMILHEALGFGSCILSLAVPETWDGVNRVEELQKFAQQLRRPMRVATRFPRLTGQFLDRYAVQNVLISAEGTLETAPAIGYADMISDLVASGQTLRDNRLKVLEGGQILRSQAVLIANFYRLKQNEQAQNLARHLLELIEAHLRGSTNFSVFANMRGPSAQAVAVRIFNHSALHGLQGPTISPVFTSEGNGDWYAVHVVVEKQEIYRAVNELRAVGGSGVVVVPVTYIFDEEPPRCLKMTQVLKSETPPRLSDLIA